MTEIEYLREFVLDDGGGHIDVWMTPPPELHVRYRIVEQTWDHDLEPSERRIYRIEPR